MAELTSAHISEALRATHRAGEAVMAIYNSPESLEVIEKPDNTPLTQADMIAHRILLDGLSALNSDIPIISEEGDKSENLERLHSDSFWLIDPLDGTKEFIAKKTGQFAICAALIEGNDPVFGIISAPALGETYFGGIKYGSYKENEENTPTALTNTAKEPSGVVLTSRSGLNRATKEYIYEHYPNHELKAVGSQLKLPYMAEGFADAYPRIGGPLHTWDLAAGQAILEGAGGQVLRFDGSRINYRAQDMKAGDFIANRFRQKD